MRMYVCGFSFIKNAIKMDYQFKEAILSILPLCDEVVIAVGDCNDGTRELAASLGPKIKIIDTVWDTSVKENGRVLADETNKAFRAISEKADWCFYIQGDEVLHEDGYETIKAAMQKYKDDKRVDGLLLKYRHFFGSYEWLGTEGQWYRNEIRIVKNNKKIYSYRDAQGFRKNDNEKLNVIALDAYIHHYGWVHNPQQIKAKTDMKDKIYRDVDKAEEPKTDLEGFTKSLVNALEKYKGTHPKVMHQRVNAADWKFDYDTAHNRLRFKDRFKNFVEKLTGRRYFDYQNYKIIN